MMIHWPSGDEEDGDASAQWSSTIDKMDDWDANMTFSVDAEILLGFAGKYVSSVSLSRNEHDLKPRISLPKTYILIQN